MPSLSTPPGIQIQLEREGLVEGSTICWIPILDSGLWTLDSGLRTFHVSLGILSSALCEGRLAGESVLTYFCLPSLGHRLRG